MVETATTPCLIIGSGPAGYTAAIYAARALLDPVLVSGEEAGGQLATTTDVENYPGFSAAVQGPALMEEMRTQATSVGAQIVSDVVISADLSRRPFEVRARSGRMWRADSLIIATGAQAKWLGLPSETRLKGYGVSACATCDGIFYRGRDVAVVGGGNTAVEEALLLARYARKVTLVHRRDSLRAEPILQRRLFEDPRIEILWRHEVEEVLGDSGVTGLRLKDKTSGRVWELPCDGLFVAIGHAPASHLFRGQLPVDPAGYLQVKPGRTTTAIDGVFAAGDVCDPFYRQAVTAAGMGCMAALEAARFLTESGVAAPTAVPA